MKLYKYKFWDEFGKKLLFENILYFASPAKFNDPFDCKVPLRYDLEKDEDLRTHLRQLFIEQGEEVSNYEVEKQVDNVIIKLKSPENLHEMIVNKGKIIEREYGVFSLSRCNKNNLLWSHYADSHEGICVEFDKAILDAVFYQHFRLRKKPINEISIEYNEEMPILKPTKLNVEDRFGVELKHKSLSWAYECEVRYIISEETNYSLTFPDNCITKIILGCEMTDENVSEISNHFLQKDYKPKIIKAKRDLLSFSLII